MWFILGLIILGIALIADIAFLIFDNLVGSYFMLAIALAVSYLVVPPVYVAVHAHTWLYLLTHYIGSYLVVGLIFAVAKWILFNFTVLGRIREVRASFTTSKSNELIQQEFADLYPDQRSGYGYGKTETFEGYRRFLFLQYWDTNTESHFPRANLKRYNQAEDANIVVQALTPRATRYIAEITLWILQWPVVLIATVIEDILVKLGKHIARLLDVILVGPMRTLVRMATKGL